MLPNTIEELIEISIDPKVEIRTVQLRSQTSPGPTLIVELVLAFSLLGPPISDLGVRVLRFEQVGPTALPSDQAILTAFAETSIPGHRWQYTFRVGALDFELIAGKRAVVFS